MGIAWSVDGSIHEKLFTTKQEFSYPFFMEVVMIGAWCIWNERNALIFNGKVPGLLSWKTAFKKVVGDHLCRIKFSLLFKCGLMLYNLFFFVALVPGFVFFIPPPLWLISG